MSGSGRCGWPVGCKTFRWFLLRNAYTRERILALAAKSAFGTGAYRVDGIGFELTLRKPPLAN